MFCLLAEACSLPRDAKGHVLFCKTFAWDPVMPGFRSLHTFSSLLFCQQLWILTASEIPVLSWVGNLRFLFSCSSDYRIHGKAWGVRSCNVVAVVRQHQVSCSSRWGCGGSTPWSCGCRSCRHPWATLASGVTATPLPTLGLLLWAALVVLCAVAKDLWPCCYVGLHSNGCHCWYRMSNNNEHFLSRLSTFLSPVNPYTLTY